MVIPLSLSVLPKYEANLLRHQQRIMGLPKSINLHSLRHHPRVAFYFRYPLYHNAFQPVKKNKRVAGYFAAKPLYGKLTSAGKVDRASGFSGKIAIIFIPSPARSLKQAKLLFARMAKSQVTLPNGKRNWPALRQAAERAVRKKLGIR